MGRAGRIAACLVAAGCAAASAEAAGADRYVVYAGVWRTAAGGTGRIGDAGTGSEFDLGDVGSGGDTSAFEAGFWFHPRGRHRLRFAAFDLSAGGAGTAPEELLADGLDLPAGTPVTSSYDLRLFEAQYAWAFVNLDVVDVSVLVGIDGMDARTSIRAASGRASGGASGAAPVVGVAARFQPVSFVRVVGEASYGGWGGRFDRVRDLSVRAEFYVIRLFGLGLGYRDLEVRADDSGEGAVDTTQRGFQAFALFRF